MYRNIHLWTGFIVLLLLIIGWAGAQERSDQMMPFEVKQFGARGDGKTDDTAAFQKALEAARQDGGGIVFAPRGNYLIAGHLDIPANVSLEGVFRTPTARTQKFGTTLLATEGAGNPEGTPFITLHANSTLKGLTIFYSDQVMKNPPIPYPWTIRGIGDNCSLIDVLLVNPYQAVDFGTHPAGRHYIKNLYAQPLYRGLFIDKCFDVGRVEDIHFWPFWGWSNGLKEYMVENAEAFIIGRTDWEYMFNCFCIGYKVGYHFIPTKDGSPNVVLTQCGSDIGPTAVLVDDCQGHAGLSFLNGQFMAGIVVKETNTGPVKFTACGFWGLGSTQNHALLQGRGHITFNGCHFIAWDQQKKGEPAIHANCEGLTVMGCDFMDAGKTQVVLDPGVKAAVVMGNRLRGGAKIVNRNKGSVQLGLNATQ